MLDWDANNNTIRTTSLHSFEGDAFVSASLPASPYGPRLLSDPQVNRYGSIFYIIQVLSCAAVYTKQCELPPS